MKLTHQTSFGCTGAGGRTDASGLEPGHLDFFVYPSNDVSGGDRRRRESLETPTMSCI